MLSCQNCYFSVMSADSAGLGDNAARPTEGGGGGGGWGPPRTPLHGSHLTYSNLCTPAGSPVIRPGHR